MTVYKAIEPDDGAMAIFAAVHLLRWEREWGEPKLLFVEAEPADLLKEERVKALVAAARRVNNTFYGMLLREWGHPDDWPNAHGKVVYNELRTALAPFEEPADG